MTATDQVKPVADAEMVPVPVSGVVAVEGTLPTTPRAADFGAWTTYTLAANTPAQPILPYDDDRSRALIVVSGTGPVFVGSQGQTQASPVLGGQLPAGTYEVKNKQALWLAPDGTHTATVTVLVERWGK